jgi:hypothetical protein
MTDLSRDRKLFAGFAAKLAAELGMVVTYREHGLGAQLGGTDGEPGYFAHEPWNRHGRVEVTGIYPASERSSRTRPSITAALDRGAAAVAGDIRRRLEPAYLAELAETNAWNERAARDDWAREQVAARIEALFPDATYRIDHRQSKSRTEVHVGSFGAGGGVRLFSRGEDVQFEDFRVPAEAGLAMLAAYAAWREREAA